MKGMNNEENKSDEIGNLTTIYELYNLHWNGSSC